jgi:hypothetical protein
LPPQARNTNLAACSSANDEAVLGPFDVSRSLYAHLAPGHLHAAVERLVAVSREEVTQK